MEFIIFLVLFDDVSENKSEAPYKKLTRASYKSATPNTKNEILDNGNKSMRNK